MNSTQAIGTTDRAVTVLVTWFLGYAVNKGWITTADSAAFLPILVAIPAAAWGWWHNRTSNIAAAAAKIANDPNSPIQGVITTNTPEGRALAKAVPENTIVAAGTVEATQLAKGPST